MQICHIAQSKYKSKQISHDYRACTQLKGYQI